MPSDPTRPFAIGATGTYPEGQVGTVVKIDTAPLALPSGNVVACDPFIDLGPNGASPFTVSAPPGTYRVDASIIQITQPGEDAASASQPRGSSSPMSPPFPGNWR